MSIVARSASVSRDISELYVAKTSVTKQISEVYVKSSGVDRKVYGEEGITSAWFKITKITALSKEFSDPSYSIGTDNSFTSSTASGGTFFLNVGTDGSIYFYIDPNTTNSITGRIYFDLYLGNVSNRTMYNVYDLLGNADSSCVVSFICENLHSNMYVYGKISCYNTSITDVKTFDVSVSSIGSGGDDKTCVYGVLSSGKVGYFRLSPITVTLDGVSYIAKPII